MAVSWALLVYRPFGREGRQQFVQQYRIRAEIDAAQSRMFDSFVRVGGLRGWVRLVCCKCGRSRVIKTKGSRCRELIGAMKSSLFVLSFEARVINSAK